MLGHEIRGVYDLCQLPGEVVLVMACDQIFCLARSIAKTKRGETPLTQMTPASQGKVV